MSSLVKISMISMISSLSLKLYLNSLVYNRKLFKSFSKVFGNLLKSSEIGGSSRKMFGTFFWPSEQFLENLCTSTYKHPLHNIFIRSQFSLTCKVGSRTFQTSLIFVLSWEYFFLPFILNCIDNRVISSAVWNKYKSTGTVFKS